MATNASTIPFGSFNGRPVWPRETRAITPRIRQPTAPAPAAWLQALEGQSATSELASSNSATGTQRIDRCRIHSSSSERASQPFQLYRQTSISAAATTVMTTDKVHQLVTKTLEEQTSE